MYMDVWHVPDCFRDTHTFTRRRGRLPEQREGDALDYRSVLHRDGSVFSVVSAQVGLSSAWVPLYLSAGL